MKLHYNFIVYLVPAPETQTLEELAMYIFSPSKERLEKLVAEFKHEYVGEYRTAILSEEGRRKIEAFEENKIDLENNHEWFIQTRWLLDYIQHDPTADPDWVPAGWEE